MANLFQYQGKTIWMTLDEVANPEHTALIVVDMQRDFCASDGAFARYGINISMYPPLVLRLGDLIAQARRVRVPVIYLLMTQLHGGVTDSPAQIRFNLRLHEARRPEPVPLQYTLDGSEGQAVLPALAPQSEDVVVKKYRSSGFWGTNLDLILRSMNRKTVIVTGCTTEGCVESTARDALFADYFVVVPEDGVASDDRAQHEASLLLMRHRFDVTTCEALIKTWEVGKHG